MKVIHAFLAFGLVLSGCDRNPKSAIEWQDSAVVTYDKIEEGIPVFDAVEGVYNRNNGSNLRIKFADPVIVDVADRPYGWGFFQFPSIYRAIDGQIVVSWHMAKDAAESYGKELSSFAVSNDEGKTWSRIDGGIPLGGGLQVSDGSLIKNHTPVALDVSSLSLPAPVDSNKEAYGRHFAYYRMSELPNELQGVYISRLNPGNDRWNIEHNVLNDPEALRYTDNELFPVVWWGDMCREADGSIVTMTYPSFYEESGKVPPSGVTFYRSKDNGKTWDRVGNIPYQPDLVNDPNGNERFSLGFTEPAFEILSDSTYLCVLRTTDGLGNSPMYISSSSDRGVSWTEPRVFTSFGVLPKLLQLDNGVVVLASGRPGVQLRFSTNGNEWTDAFEMLEFEGQSEAVSCGYPYLFPLGKNRFLVVYSNFVYQNDDGENRKAIVTREITIDQYE